MNEFKYEINGVLITFNKEVVEKNFANGEQVSDGEYNTFGHLCQEHKLNPFCKDVWFIRLNGRTNIMVGKDGYFKIADSNPNYDGMEDGIVVKNAKGEVINVNGCLVPPGTELIGGWAKAYSKNRSHPKYAVCSLEEYRGNEKSLWGSKPATMINKVAKCVALRDLFPTSFAGTYAEEEINNAPAPGTEKVEKEEVLPPIEEALKFKFGEKYKQITGLTIQEMVDNEKKSCIAVLQTIAKKNSEGSPEAKAVLKAIADGTIVPKFIEKPKEGK